MVTQWSVAILTGFLMVACAADPAALSGPTAPKHSVAGNPVLAAAAVVAAPPAVDDADPVASAARREGTVRVVVYLHDPAQLDDPGREAAVARVQAAVLQRLPQADFRLVRRYGLVSALAGVATVQGIGILRTLPEVAAVWRDGTVAANLAQTAALVQAPQARKQFGVTGKGVRVAVIDSGIEATHPDLAGRVAAEKCLATGACAPGNTDSGSSAKDDNGHGTHVSSIIAGNGVVAAPGMAPGSQIVAVRVLGKNGSGYDSDIVAGLDWVAQHAVELNVRVVNMSLGSSNVYASKCDASQPATAQAVQLLKAKKVSVFAAAGNDGATSGLSAPACVSDVVSVGAVYDANVGPRFYPGLCSDTTTAPLQMTCFSNRSASLDLVAPGAIVTAAGLGGKTAQMSGTSQASPVAAGVAALVLSCKPTLQPAALRTLLRKTGKLVPDSMTGKSHPLVQALAAVTSACSK